MEILKERILQDGRALSETVLKVDSFLNHGVDSRLMYEIGTYFKEYYKNHGITKIFTIESSGIAPTVMTAMQMELPMVTLKKQSSISNYCTFIYKRDRLWINFIKKLHIKGW